MNVRHDYNFVPIRNNANDTSGVSYQYAAFITKWEFTTYDWGKKSTWTAIQLVFTTSQLENPDLPLGYEHSIIGCHTSVHLIHLKRVGASSLNAPTCSLWARFSAQTLLTPDWVYNAWTGICTCYGNGLVRAEKSPPFQIVMHYGDKKCPSCAYMNFKKQPFDQRS